MVWARSTWDDQEVVRSRLASMTDHPPSLESSWYGPFVKLITGHLNDRAMLKPQAPLRDTVENSDPDASFNTIDSYGAETTGREGQKAYPDFALCMFSASTTGDTLKAIIEIKHPGKDGEARRDLLHYLDLHGDPSVLGIGVAGVRAVVYQLDSTLPSGYRVVKRMHLLKESFPQYIYNLMQGA